MKKNDEMIKRMATEFGEHTPDFTVLSLKHFMKAIEDYETAGPIDILGGEELTKEAKDNKRVVMLGKLIRTMANASVFYDVLMEHYGIKWEEIEKYVQEITLDKTVRPIEFNYGDTHTRV